MQPEPLTLAGEALSDIDPNASLPDPDIIVPTVNENGSTLITLHALHYDNATRVRSVIEDLQANPPKVEDYASHPDPREAFRRALREHGDRVIALMTVYDELAFLAEKISVQ